MHHAMDNVTRSLDMLIFVATRTLVLPVVKDALEVVFKFSHL